MNQRTLLDRLLSPAGFGLVLLFFLLPFVTVSCGVDNDKISANFTGVDLLVGGPPDITGHDVDADAAAQLVAVFETTTRSSRWPSWRPDWSSSACCWR